jgi:hypothetical protein
MIAVQEKFMMKRLARDCGPSFTVARASTDQTFSLPYLKPNQSPACRHLTGTN